jgi:hypothetical protein
MQFVNGLFGNNGDSIYNSHGHRCKEPDQVNLRNHILIVGDGAGLVLDKPIENTFPYILSKTLNIDYYNLSVFNGGADSIKYNLLVWLKKFGKPRAIVIACEFANAVIISDQNCSKFEAADMADPVIEDLNNHANFCGFFNGRNFLLDKLVENYNSIPIYQLTKKNQVTIFKHSIDINIDDLAQEDIAKLLHEKISTKITMAKVGI